MNIRYVLTQPLWDVISHNFQISVACFENVWRKGQNFFFRNGKWDAPAVISSGNNVESTLWKSFLLIWNCGEIQKICDKIDYQPTITMETFRSWKELKFWSSANWSLCSSISTWLSSWLDIVKRYEELIVYLVLYKCLLLLIMSGLQYKTKCDFETALLQCLSLLTQKCTLMSICLNS